MLCVKILLMTLVLLTYFDCNSVKNNNSPQNKLPEVATTAPQNRERREEIPQDLLITLERTMCYGNCPAYKLSVNSDGNVSFEGLSFTKVTGKAEGKISAEKVGQLIKEFENADYFNLNDEYTYSNCNSITDQPSALTSIQINGQKKSVNHYHGCIGDGDLKEKLSKLTQLENRIDEIVETKRWVGEQK